MFTSQKRQTDANRHRIEAGRASRVVTNRSQKRRRNGVSSSRYRRGYLR